MSFSSPTHPPTHTHTTAPPHPASASPFTVPSPYTHAPPPVNKAFTTGREPCLVSVIIYSKELLKYCTSGRYEGRQAEQYFVLTHLRCRLRADKRDQRRITGDYRHARACAHTHTHTHTHRPCTRARKHTHVRVLVTYSLLRLTVHFV